MDLVQGATNYTARLYDGYVWTLTLAEPRVQPWLLVRSPVPLFTLIGLYYTMVILGPKYMKDRKPFSLRWVLFFYSMGLSLLSVYIAGTLLYLATKMNYSFYCEPYYPLKTADDVHLASVLWWYYFSKFIEFGDTLFFILRKKDKQLTFLHVYHHSTMPFFCWIGVKWVPRGMPFVGATLNSIVHIIMYAYYGLSAMGPGVQKYLWWKKYITIIQLIQFFYGLGLGCVMVVDDGCKFPYWIRLTTVIYMTSFIVLFLNFYLHAYIKNKRIAANMKKTHIKETETNGPHKNGYLNFEENAARLRYTNKTLS